MTNDRTSFQQEKNQHSICLKGTIFQIATHFTIRETQCYIGSLNNGEGGHVALAKVIYSNFAP